MSEIHFLIKPDDLDFDLPEALIAQEPLTERDGARLMVLSRGGEEVQHKFFRDLPQFLKAGDLLVLNAAFVNRAKFLGQKPTGGKCEIIFLEPQNAGLWTALIRPEVKDGLEILLETGHKLKIQGRAEKGEYLVAPEEFNPETLMNQSGRIPLPPYIKRAADDPRSETDKIYYQTVFGREPGSIAAPTAGLHFSPALLAALKAQGVIIQELVLHVGWGTFKPLARDIQQHVMLAEKYELTPGLLEALAAAKREGRRIVAVGTTVTRVLESLPEDLENVPMKGATQIFIKPGFEFRWINGLITNFHVPRSTPVALTGAFAGLDRLSSAYAEAIKREYRFFSYGDAMIII